MTKKRQYGGFEIVRNQSKVFLMFSLNVVVKSFARKK